MVFTGKIFSKFGADLGPREKFSPLMFTYVAFLCLFKLVYTAPSFPLSIARQMSVSTEERLATRYAGKTVGVCVSGGLDSKTVCKKLVETGVLHSA